MANNTNPLLTGVSIRFFRREVTLCRYDGSEFPGGVVVTKLKPIARRTLPTIVEYADNTREWVAVGQKRTEIKSMVLNCFRPEAASQIMQNIANVNNRGLFTLVIPPRSGINESTRRHYVRFFACDFEPQTRRGFLTQLFQATVSDIDVFGGPG